MAVAYNTSIVTSGLALSMDPGNPKSYSPNVHPKPLDMVSWFTGTTGACIISRDSATAASPAGGIPLRMDVTGTDPYMAAYNSASYHLATAAPGETWTVSVWVKGSVATTAEIFIFGDSAAGGNVFTYNDYGASTVSVTTGWTRVSYTRAFSVAGVARIQVRLDGPNSGGTGQTVWWDGLQVEKNTTPTNFNPRPNPTSTWTDLTNTINGTLLGVAVPYSIDGGGCFDFAANAGLNATTAISGFFWAPQPIPTTGSFSINCWVKNVPAIVSQQAMFSNTADGNGYRFGIGANGVYFLVGPNYTESTLTFSSFNNSQWNNVCVVFDRQGVVSGSPRMTGYLNGVQFATATLPAGQYSWPATGYTTAYMAKWNGTTFASFSGKVAKFDVYNKVLLDNEVKRNFSALRGRFGI
jgi:hypothetical protein